MRGPERIIRRSIATALLLSSGGLWLIESDVPRLIARQRDVLLGRYSLPWCTALLVLTPILWVLAANVAWPQKLTAKLVGFRILAVALTIVPALVIVDVVGRYVRTPRYVERRELRLEHWPAERVGSVLRHRPPSTRYEVSYTDQPETARSYPNAPRGYGTVRVTLTTDHRGFRNQNAHETQDPRDRYDMIVLGDSFTEGSRVDDQEPWPVLLQEATGQTVYSLAVSGGSPGFYVTALEAYGLELRPHTAICMLYEGNDFKAAAEGGPKDGQGLMQIIETSPIRLGLRRALVRVLGPLNARAPVDPVPGLSWIPLAVPAPGPGQRAPGYYAFAPKRIIRLNQTKAEMAQSRAWRDTARDLERFVTTCRSHGIRPVLTYAPTKARVVLPLVRDRISARALHAFASFEARNLPPPSRFKDELYANLDVTENLVERFCREHEVAFVSPTKALRDAMARGVQVYYTYDQHWTAPGHQVVAEVISTFLGTHAEREEGTRDQGTEGRRD